MDERSLNAGECPRRYLGAGAEVERTNTALETMIDDISEVQTLLSKGSAVTLEPEHIDM